ncbi:hypothetical protein GCM10023194_40860 [Planotetraspora phitsanulokensis]|uniref:DUF2637 domain-containing protein n=1 Tax=Planotetraspora phitsanulokensis TaxID=575192 RepID=A0A8J3XIH4_9ACTN|nr:DUF2637 domain-containing protein [Planotetraspora phitsanulokensis]GII40926.1 hypothetical protein Pph01_59290 [Planotetraspora phitsanulokensis]
MSAPRPGRFRAAVVDSAPVLILAGIAAVGSFTHISTLAAKYGQKGWQSWAVAVCIDLMCVMAAREIQRDKRTGRPRRGLLSWPSLVLSGGIVLTLAANLAEAHHSPWGWIVAGTPAGAFLIAMSMLERRAGHTPQPRVVDAELIPEQSSPAAPAPAAATPAIAAEPHPQLSPSAPARPAVTPVLSPAVLDDARYLADEHARLHGTSITAGELQRRLRLSPDLSSEVLRQIGLIPETA